MTDRKSFELPRIARTARFLEGGEWLSFGPLPTPPGHSFSKWPGFVLPEAFKPSKPKLDSDLGPAEMGSKHVVRRAPCTTDGRLSKCARVRVSWPSCLHQRIYVIYRDFCCGIRMRQAVNRTCIPVGISQRHIPNTLNPRPTHPLGRHGVSGEDFVGTAIVGTLYGHICPDTGSSGRSASARRGYHPWSSGPTD